MIISGKKYLLGLDEYTLMADGLVYRFVYGTVYISKAEDFLGFSSRGHANWFVSVGGVNTEEDHKYFSAGGCRVNYWYPMETPPPILRTNMTMLLGSDNIPFPFYYPNVYIIND